MRRLLLAVLLLAGCSDDADTPEAQPTTTTTTTAPSCETGDGTEDAVCRFIADERETLPAGEWELVGCEAVGDISARCEVRFVDAGKTASFDVTPANGEYDPATGGFTPPEGEPLRYDVIVSEPAR